jgi:hypothetical protein
MDEKMTYRSSSTVSGMFTSLSGLAWLDRPALPRNVRLHQANGPNQLGERKNVRMEDRRQQLMVWKSG